MNLLKTDLMWIRRSNSFIKITFPSHSQKIILVSPTLGSTMDRKFMAVQTNKILPKGKIMPTWKQNFALLVILEILKPEINNYLLYPTGPRGGVSCKFALLSSFQVFSGNLICVQNLYKLFHGETNKKVTILFRWVRLI